MRCWSPPLALRPEKDVSVSPKLEHSHYTIRRKILTIFGAKFHVFDPSGNVVMFIKQKAFKLKEDIRVYTDESMAHEMLSIRARSIIDFSAAYDVVDSDGVKIGALRRRGMRSIVRDSWEFLDVNDQPIGQLEEDSTAMALARRLLGSLLIPQTFYLRRGEYDLVQYKQFFNPFVLKYRVDILPDAHEFIDPLLVVAGGILLAAIEGRQSGG